MFVYFSLSGMKIKLQEHLLFVVLCYISLFLSERIAHFYSLGGLRKNSNTYETIWLTAPGNKLLVKKLKKSPSIALLR